MSDETKNTTDKKEKKPFVMSEEQALNLLKIVDDLQKKDKEKDELIAKLTYAADKGRLEKFDANNKKNDLIPKCKVSTWENKIIVGSRMLPQEVYVDHVGVYHERQQVEMFLDGEKDALVVDYKDQFRNVKKVDAQILSKSVDSDGNTTVVCELVDGRKVTLDIAFIN